MNTTLFVQALVLTLLIEIPIYTLLLRYFANVSVWQALVAAILVNLISYPLFVALLVPFGSQYLAPVPAVLVGEAIVCIVEAALLSAWLRRDSLVVIAVVLVANGCSMVAGLGYFALVAHWW